MCIIERTREKKKTDRVRRRRNKDEIPFVEQKQKKKKTDSELNKTLAPEHNKKTHSNKYHTTGKKELRRK